MILICNGAPGSGKDAICEYLKTKNFKHIEFKEQLFIDTINEFNVDEKWFFEGYTREQKDIPEERLGGKSRRTALIHTSENVYKKKYGNDYYGRQAANKMKPYGSYCISDGGFIEELSHIINKFGKDDILMIRLYRTGSSFEGDSRKYINCANTIDTYICGEKTNTEILETQCFDETVELNNVIIHNNGTLYELYDVIDNIIRKFDERQIRN